MADAPPPIPATDLELPTWDSIVILDFGSQYSHLIARRIREANCFCELFSCKVEAEELLKIPRIKGVILSGGPSSVYDADAPHVSESVWAMIEERKLPLLGICYGMQEITNRFGGKVEGSHKREYGRANVTVKQGLPEGADLLFQGLGTEIEVWMSHGDKLTSIPEGFVDVAGTPTAPHVAISDPARKMYALQFHPEVTHTPQGTQLLKRFVTLCGVDASWNMSSIADTFIHKVREQVGTTGRVIGAVSGGVDSSVAAVLLQRAIGSRFHAVLIDNGLLRKDEAVEVDRRLRAQLNINLHTIDASERFLAALQGVDEPERKRKIIGNLFIEVFQEEANRIKQQEGTPVDFLLQGTLYPDVIESVSYKGPSATIKSHHNVGGLPASMKLKLIEPLRELFKDEVRSLGLALGVPHESVWRHPFPGPGLAIRMLGAVDKQGLDLLREADAIYMQELRESGNYEKIGQAFVVLLPCKSVGVMGDGRTYERVAAVRAVATSDYMTADWYHMPYEVLARISNRIINEVSGINRVCYDISSKPPATIEWE